MRRLPGGFPGLQNLRSDALTSLVETNYADRSQIGPSNPERITVLLSENIEPITHRLIVHRSDQVVVQLATTKISSNDLNNFEASGFSEVDSYRGSQVFDRIAS